MHKFYVHTPLAFVMRGGRQEVDVDNNQCFRFSRNTAKVTPKIIYFYYQK